MTMKPSLTPLLPPPPPTPSKCLVKRGMTIEQNEYDECFLQNFTDSEFYTQRFIPYGNLLMKPLLVFCPMIFNPLLSKT